MSVVEAVVHHATRAARLDDAGRAQQAQRVGDVGLGRVGRGREIADAEFAGLEKGVEQARAGDVAEEPEELGEGSARRRAGAPGGTTRSASMTRAVQASSPTTSPGMASSL